MSKIRWLLAALGMALIGLVPILGATSPASADPGTRLRGFGLSGRCRCGRQHRGREKLGPHLPREPHDGAREA